MFTKTKSQKPRIALVFNSDGLEGCYIMTGNDVDQTWLTSIVERIREDLNKLWLKATAESRSN